MPPELAVHHDPHLSPDVPADSWTLPAEVIEELRKAALEGVDTTVITQRVSYTGYGGTMPAEQVRTLRGGTITAVEPGRLTIEVKAGWTFTQTSDMPRSQRISGILVDKGSTVVPVFRERRWSEVVAPEYDLGVVDGDTIIATEYIAAISFGRSPRFNFDPPPPHLHFA